MRHITALALACWLVLFAAGANAASERSAFLTRLTPSHPQPQAWKRSAAAASWRPVAAGDRFGEGDSLRTAPGSRGELAFASGLSVRLLGEVELKLHSQGLNGTGLDLAKGKVVVLGATAGSVQVTTFEAIATTRQAELLVEKTPKGTRLALLSGQASIMSDLRESVHEISTLEAGQQILVAASGPPADPYAVDPARLAAEAGLPIPAPAPETVVVVPAAPASPAAATTPEPAAVQPSEPPVAPSPAATAAAAPSPVVAPSRSPEVIAPSASPAAPVAHLPTAAPTTAPTSPSPSAAVIVVPSAQPPSAIPSSEPSPALVPTPEPSVAASASPEVITIPSPVPSPNITQSPSPVPSHSPTPRHAPAPRVAATPLPLPANPPSPEVAPGVLARMVVLKRQHRLYFFEPDGSLKKVYKIGLGAPGTPTPTGVRAVYEKLANPTGVAWALWPSSRGRAFGNRMLVLMWFDPVNQRYTYKSKQELHGTDVRVSVGGNMSHGCMRMLNEDIEEVYKNARKGDIIWVRDL